MVIASFKHITYQNIYKRKNTQYPLKMHIYNILYISLQLLLVFYIKEHFRIKQIFFIISYYSLLSGIQISDYQLYLFKSK